MLTYTMLLLALALLAALLGFSGVAWGIAAVTCVSLLVFVVASAATLVWQIDQHQRHSASL